jgi:hypothetical protein
MIVKLKSNFHSHDGTGFLSTIKSIQCWCYEELYYENRTEIIVYGNPEEPGRVHTLITKEHYNELLQNNPDGLPHQYWEVAFIENDNGQTINKITPPKFHR